MTSHVIDLIWSGQFHIITYPKINLLLIICYLIYLIFLVNLSNQPFKSTFQIHFQNQLFKLTYAINLPIKLATPLACGTLFPQQTYICKRVYFYLLRYVWFKWLTFLQITHLSRRDVYHPWAHFSSDVDESFARCSLEFFLMWTSVFVFYIRWDFD